MKKNMHILLTNDDGIFAPGLAAIYKLLVAMGDVTVVAPASSQSGASHSITYKEPLVCNKVEIEGLFSGFGVHGSPADCVKLARMQLADRPFDLLASGINNGANAGINVYYSGTVAAAIEGSFLGIPAVAMSLASEEKLDFETAAKHCLAVLKKLMPVKPGEVININIPLLSQGEPKGVKVVPRDVLLKLVPQPVNEFLTENEESAARPLEAFEVMIIEVRGTKSGEDLTYTITCPFRFFWNAAERLEIYRQLGATGVDVALPAVVGAKMCAEGEADRGVIAAECLDPVLFLKNMARAGVLVRFREECSKNVILS